MEITNTMRITRGIPISERLAWLLHQGKDSIKPEYFDAIDAMFVHLAHSSIVSGIVSGTGSDKVVDDIKFDIMKVVKTQHRSTIYELLVMGITNGKDHIVVFYCTGPNQSITDAMGRVDIHKSDNTVYLHLLRQQLRAVPCWEESRKFNPIDVEAFIESYMSPPVEKAVVEDLTGYSLRRGEGNSSLYIYWK